MYELRPPAVYAHESAVAEEHLKRRVDRVVAGLAGPAELKVYRDEDLPGIIKAERLNERRAAMGTLETVPDPVLIFNTFRFDGRRAERMAWLASQCDAPSYHMGETLAGYGPFCWWDVGLATDQRAKDSICRPCWRVHFQNGCAHKCLYCGLGGVLITMVNVEQYIEHFDRLIALNDWQETYLLEDDADVLCLEPELGCLGPIIEYFGTLEGKYLVLHTKSANVDWMLDLKHNGRTIIVWSVSGPSQAELLEPVAASTADRIAAARKAQQAGYVVRYKFKPIIPVRSWRVDAAEAVGMIFDQTRPDVISLCVLMWMDAAEMKRRIDPGLLDPALLAAAEQAVERVATSHCRPFPPEARVEIYGHYVDQIRARDGQVPVSLSTENAEMWRLLGGRLGATASTYVCGCGPNSIPGRRALTCNPFRLASTGPVGGFEEM